ncbi:T9SS type A sorting domain-containing protein [Lewinella lacunae]|uniref:T9SS type A sorting domain-containing protein n=1 Tax=Neolewinella lacunae TaxID=1517758 RepID=A0A923PFL0_9BACT|nr:T9SS type A sorting domain-containing protein [Neolewinella lacunae]MBC6993167.1 T9SS type A sorting domain-containing protein [Neolewinella lacunae]
MAIIGTTLFISNLFLRLDANGEVVGAFSREIGGEIDKNSQLSSSGDTLILSELSNITRRHQVFTMTSVLTPVSNLNGQFSRVYKSYLLEGNSLYAATFFSSPPGNNLNIFKYQFTRPGTVAWQIDYGNTDFFNLDYASRAIALPDESFLVVGRLSPDGLISEQLLFHFNADGTERWRSAFDSAEAEGISLQDMLLAPNGDVIINYLKNQSGRSFVARFSQVGEILWQYELGALSIANPAVRNTLFTLPDGRIVAAIFAAEAGRTHQLKFTFLSPDGEFLESQYLVGFTSGSSYSVAALANGKILLTGTWRNTQELTAGEYDPETGSLVWSRPLAANPSLRNFVAPQLWEPLSASYFLLSTEIDTVDFGHDLWLTNLAADGTVIRREEIGRTREGNSRSVLQLTQAGELFITYSAPIPGTPGPYEYFQYNVEWRNPANYAVTAQGSIRNPFGFLGINDVQPVGTDALLLVGMGESSPRGGWDIMLIRTTQDQLVALGNPGSALALGADLYPNPSTGHTTARITTPTSSPLYWQLYSAAGQTVAKGTAAAAQVHTLSLDLTAQRPGLYLLYARDGSGRSVVQKILLARGE